jgi:glutaconyl-CoA/methylmalonyl-CoA decarboxylase subunit delta
MNVFTLILYMYAITAIISFFVAFLINTIYTLLKFFENKKKFKMEVSPVTAADMKNVQTEAVLMQNEGEVMAVIAAALYLHSKETHDNENLKLTIKKSSRPYSPWSSKIYGLNIYKR